MTSDYDNDHFRQGLKLQHSRGSGHGQWSWSWLWSNSPKKKTYSFEQLLDKPLGRHHVFRAKGEEIDACGQGLHVDAELAAACLLAEQQGTGHVEDFVLPNSFFAHHVEAVGGGVGIDREERAVVFVHLVVGPVKGDVVDVEHEMVGAAEVDDGHVDVLPLVVAEVYAVVMPAAGAFGVHVGFPYDGAKEHYILDIEHRNEAIKIIKTLLPLIPYPKKRKK